MSADFIDSNVFIYLFDHADDRKRGVARGVLRRAQSNHDATISFQVIQETLNFITQKAKPQATSEEAREFLDDVLAPLWRVMPSAGLYRRALQIQASYQYSFYDALVVAAALQGGCERLITEDLHDGQRIEGLKIENPFRVV